MSTLDRAELADKLDLEILRRDLERTREELRALQIHTRALEAEANDRRAVERREAYARFLAGHTEAQAQAKLAEWDRLDAPITKLKPPPDLPRLVRRERGTCTDALQSWGNNFNGGVQFWAWSAGQLAWDPTSRRAAVHLTGGPLFYQGNVASPQMAADRALSARAKYLAEAGA